MSRVSICITTYNRAATLPETLDSILQQTFDDFELIISDDNSTDGTQELCKAYADKDPRIKYFRNPENLKMPGNLNSAISKASGEFIANLHDGDIYRVDLIEKWYNTLVKYPEALFVYNQYRMLDKEGNTVTVIDHKLSEVNDGSCLTDYFFKNLSSAPWGTVMARKTAYRQYGMFDNQYEFISDVEMWLRLGIHGKVCYVSEPLIELAPRELDHPYYLPHWKIFYLNISILFRYLNETKSTLPKAEVKKHIKKQLLRSFFILLKHFSIKRARMFLYLVFTSPYMDVKILLCPFTILIPVKPTSFDKIKWRKLCQLT